MNNTRIVATVDMSTLYNEVTTLLREAEYLYVSLRTVEIWLPTTKNSAHYSTQQSYSSHSGKHQGYKYKPNQFKVLMTKVSHNENLVHTEPSHDSKPTCSYFKKTGHTSENCWTRQKAERKSTPAKSPEFTAWQRQWRKPSGPGDPHTKVNDKNGKTYYWCAKSFGGHWQKYHLTSKHVSKKSSTNIAVATSEDTSQLTSLLTMVLEGATKSEGALGGAGHFF